MADNNESLKKELETYQALLPSLADKDGKYALISGEKLLGTFDTYSDALDEGYRKNGLEPFLVKRISTIETIAFFTRDFRPCLTSATQ
jgi:hypothetical protein